MTRLYELRDGSRYIYWLEASEAEVRATASAILATYPGLVLVVESMAHVGNATLQPCYQKEVLHA